MKNVFSAAPNVLFGVALVVLLAVSGAGGKSIAAGGYHACAILQGGVLKCWGYNLYGQLGLGDAVTRGDGPGEMGSALPEVDVGTGRTVKKVFAGQYHTCAILDDGKVKCWGYGSKGNLGNGATAHAGTSATHMGDNLAHADLGASSTAKDMCLGYYHTCALLDTLGDVMCWGDNLYGQLGIDSTVANKLEPTLVLIGSVKAKAIACGAHHVCAVLTSGAVRCWGRNNYGQLGINLASTINRGDSAGETANALSLVKDLGLGVSRSAKAVSCGQYHCCVIMDNNEIKCWGRNTYGELGVGDTVTYGLPVALKTEGITVTKVANPMSELDSTQLGSGVTPLLYSIDHTSPIACGVSTTCILRNDGKFKCYGLASGGATGYGGFTNKGGSGTTDLGDKYLAGMGTGMKAVDVSSFGAFNCAVLENKTLKCWGEGKHGALGSGAQDNIAGTYAGIAGSVGDDIPVVDLGGTPVAIPTCACMRPLGFKWNGVYA